MGAALHSAINTAGPRAHEIAELLTLFTAICAVVYLIVIGTLVWALMRKRARARLASEAERAIADRKARHVISWATALTVLILITLGLADLFVQRSLFTPPKDPLRILVTGHQYWWEIEYDHSDPSQRVRTANELHIPTGKPVELVLASRDVIHSFWLPSITGKKDLIPGRTNTEVLIADKPGIYTGQCAEFCGLQHARMKLVLHADTPADFETWRQQQLQPGREPSTDEERRGRSVFTSASCVLCHSVQGTDASATVGPDLTHVASRSMIAAGTLTNTPGNLSAWILAPHKLKPGVQMPATSLPPDDLGALTQYLASLR
jgi:cytochrome c oxidase subunit II